MEIGLVISMFRYHRPFSKLHLLLRIVLFRRHLLHIVVQVAAVQRPHFLIQDLSVLQIRTYKIQHYQELVHTRVELILQHQDYR